MKDNFCGNTDLLDRDDRSDELVESHLTELQSSSDGQDLLSKWNASDDDEESLRESQLYDQLLASNAVRNASGESATFVPDESKNSILGSMLSRSFLSEPAHNKTDKAKDLQLPELGDNIFGFQLLSKLGAGTFARVFLAKQDDLADREVVLKVSAIEGTEPQTLAQLQHTHVVPIYSVHEDEKNGLRAVCMPYFGGASLNRVLEEVWRKKRIPQQGQVLVEALDNSAGPEPATRVAQREAAARLANTPDAPVVEAPHTARNILSNLPFVQAASWVIARLAEGLQHSHERNVIHRDIKPSNILLSAEGQPLLLDFNVSQVVDCHPSDATLGGTLSYMAPEHLNAAITRDATSITTINHRSDIYALGLVFYEMLVGELPFRTQNQGSVDPRSLQRMLAERQQPVPSLKKTSPLEIPWSLESIVRKCLAPLPQDRYASAGQLAEDLNRFLSDQPLKYAPELSGWEQFRKWVRRHPRLTSSSVVSLLASLVIIPGVVLLGLWAVRIQDAEMANLARQLEKGTLESQQKTNLVVPNQDLSREGIVECQQTLKIFNVLDDPNWQDRVHWKRLPEVQRRKLSENVREVLIILAAAEVDLAKNADDVVEAALKKLEIAEQIRDLPPSKALLMDRARYLKSLKRDSDAQAAAQLAEQIPALSPHDKYMQAAALARQRTAESVKQALNLLSQSIHQNPEHYWSIFERALCYEELGDHALALGDLSRCIGLWPKSAAAYFNRGHLLDELGREEQAEEDYTAAIQYDDRLWSAYSNRGLIRLEMRSHELALADFDMAIRGRGQRATDVSARGMALEGLGRHSEADQAFDDAMRLAQLDSSVDINRIRWTYAFAIASRDRKTARRVFNEVLQEQPTHPQANYGLGMLLMEGGQLKDAVRSFDEAILSDPSFIEPVRYRAITLARLGEFEAASVDSDFCIKREPNNPDTLYANACVAAIAYRKFRSRQLADQALIVLRKAIVCGARKDRAAADSDFSALWNDPEFRELTGTVHQRNPELDRS